MRPTVGRLLGGVVEIHPFNPSPNARETRPHRPIVPRFRGNLFYVVQRYRTTAIANGDCHKDLHRSVQIAYFAQRKSLYRVVVVLYGVLVYFMTCPTVNRHSPDARHNVLLILSTDIGGAGTVRFGTRGERTMQPTVVRLHGGVVVLHPFKPHCASNSSGGRGSGSHLRN